MHTAALSFHLHMIFCVFYENIFRKHSDSIHIILLIQKIKYALLFKT